MRTIRPLRPYFLYRYDLDLLLLSLFAVGILGWLMLHVDVQMVRWVRGLPDWRLWMYQFISHLGNSGLVLWPSGLGLIALYWIWRYSTGTVKHLVAALMVRFGIIFLAVGVPGLLVAIVKRLIGRARPTFIEEMGHLTFTPFAQSSYFASFPSGHTTTAFAFAAAAGALWPAARIPLFILAAVIGVTRVTIGVHYPSDVFMGALIGSLGAWLIVRLFAAQRRGFAVGAEGAIRPMPGPSLRRLRSFAASLYGRTLERLRLARYPA
jgi:membrane-associated phospholipid phosphatase